MLSLNDRPRSLSDSPTDRGVHRTFQLGHDVGHRPVAEQHGARRGGAVGAGRLLAGDIVAIGIVVGDERLQRRGDLVGVGSDVDIDRVAVRTGAGRLQQMERHAIEHIVDVVAVALQRHAVERELCCHVPAATLL